MSSGSISLIKFDSSLNFLARSGKNKLCFSPNQHAPKPSMRVMNNEIQVNGYQIVKVENIHIN